MKKNSLNIWHKINPVLGFIAMFVTQDVVLRFFFRKKKILKNGFSIPINSSIILAPPHRSRWDGLILTMAMGRRVTKKDCRFMVTKSEMRGIQGWFLKRTLYPSHFGFSNHKSTILFCYPSTCLLYTSDAADE